MSNCAVHTALLEPGKLGIQSEELMCMGTQSKNRTEAGTEESAAPQRQPGQAAARCTKRVQNSESRPSGQSCVVVVSFFLLPESTRKIFAKIKKMTIIKWIYTGFKRTSGQLKSQNESDSEAISGSVHSTPPGEWPSVGPQPSKLAVVLFYISVAATILGSIISIRTLFYKDVRTASCQIIVQHLFIAYLCYFVYKYSIFNIQKSFKTREMTCREL